VLKRGQVTAVVPASVVRAVWLVWALIAWSGLIALLTVVFDDRLVSTWAKGNPTAAPILKERGLDGLKESSINIPHFAAVAIVLFVVFAALAGVLVAFFRAGHRWARVVLTATVVLMAFSTLVGIRRDLPALFIVLSMGALLLSVALLVMLWHRDTSAFLRASLPPPPEPASHPE